MKDTDYIQSESYKSIRNSPSDKYQKQIQLQQLITINPQPSQLYSLIKLI